MAYKLHVWQTVDINGKECQPEINTELELRLAQLSQQNPELFNAETDELLASAFPKEEAYVKKMLKITPKLEKQLLLTYLIGGERAVKEAIGKVSTSFDEAIEDNKND